MENNTILYISQEAFFTGVSFALGLYAIITVHIVLAGIIYLFQRIYKWLWRRFNG